MKAPVNSRYAHCDGVTDIALYDDGNDGKILTCGSDGDVRMWSCPDDKEPLVFSSSDAGLGICCYKNTVYVGTENNTVESFSLPSGKAEKVVTKFTSSVNHVDVSKSGSIMLAGSGDMTIQLIKLTESSSPPIKIEAHSAPVLSVRIDPLEEFFISSGCDGIVSIWNLLGKQVKSWDCVFPSSNDIMTSKTLCRPSWKPDGSIIGIPCKNEVILYSRNNWKEEKKLKTSGTKMLSVTQFSSCSKYFVAGSTDGTIFIWNVETSKLVYENADTKDQLTGVLFSKSCKDIVAVDIKGRMIFVNDFLGTHDTQNDIDMDDELGDEVDNFVDRNAVTENDPFDDDMDEFLADDGDGNEISISKIKAESGFIASEKEDVFVGVDKARKSAGLKRVVDDDAASVSSMDGHKHSADEEKRRYTPVPIEMPFTEPQKPFQPSSSPEHLQHRFMVWNGLGLIRNYEIEDDEADAIDIEFHDVSFHTGIHLRNQHDYTIAAMGKEAIVFASPRSSNANSKIMCLHFSSWDNSKEWSTDLPTDEEATTAAVGTGWLAVGTNMNRLRVFTIAGVQRNVLDIGGQIIAISGHEDLLFVTFHSGIGLHGNQCVSYYIIRIRSGTGLFPLISSEPLPLSPKSEIAWMGFSDEGTPSVSDSTGTVRILSGRMWTTFLCMKEGSRNDSDHYWVTSLSVCNQQIRAIRCKGTIYPPTLPRPTILLLDAKLPLCEMETEKSQLEDVLLRSVMQNALAKKLDKKGADVEQYRDKAEKDIRENLMKLFAICCKGDKDFRASEYVTMMNGTHSIQVAIKYANKLRKMALTDRLTAIGRKKLDEEEDNIEEDEDDFENMRTGNVIYSSVYSTLGNPEALSDSRLSSSMGGSFLANQSSDVVFLEENPLLTRQRKEIQALCSSSPANYKNPFKRDSIVDLSNSKSKSVIASTSDVHKSDLDNSGKGLALIDAWKKPIEKPTMEFNPKHSKSKTSKKASDKEKSDKNVKAKTDKPTSNIGGKKQPTLFAMAGRKSLPEQEPSSPSIDVDENSNNGVVDSGNGELDSGHADKKRKRSGDNDANEEIEKKSRISAKLSAFALNRNTNVNVNEEVNDELADV